MTSATSRAKVGVGNSGGLEEAARADPIGHSVQAIMAGVCIGLLPVTVAGATIALIVLLIYAILRLHCTGAISWALLRRPVMVASFGLAVWWAVTTLWSPTPWYGLEHLRALRWLILPVLVWPVIDHRDYFIICALCGIAVLNVSQLVEAAAQYAETGRFADRAGGLMTHEPYAGLWSLVGMFGWLGLVMAGRRWWRLAAGIGFCLATVGLLIAGGRAAWVATVIAGGVMLPILWLRCPVYRRWILIGTALVPLLILAAWPVFGAPAEKIFAHTRYGVRKFIETGNPAGYQMIRLLWNKRALVYWTSAPVQGVGLGGFSALILQDDVLRDTSRDATRSDKSNDPNWRGYVAEHPHNTYVVALSETGLIGFGLLAIILIATWRQCWKAISSDGFGLLQFGWFLAWLVAAAFDCFMYAGQTISLLAMIISLSLTVPVADRLWVDRRLILNSGPPLPE